MEFEIADRPQLGEDDTYEPFVSAHPVAAPHHVPKGERTDRAVIIPEQETGS